MKNQIEKLQEKINAIKALRKDVNTRLKNAISFLTSSIEDMETQYTGKSEKAATRRAIYTIERAARLINETAREYDDEN